MSKTPVFISTNRTEARPCPICHAHLDAVTCLALDRQAGPVHMGLGDITKCAYCGTLLKLTEFGFVVAKPADLIGLDDLLQGLLHEMPTMDELRGKKKRPS